MRTVTLLTVGKLKESYLRDACAEYCKRLSSYCKLQLIEIPEEKCPDNPSAAQIEAVLEKEGARILQKLPPGAYTAALCIEGELLPSPGLAHRLAAVDLSEKNGAAFIIGGSFGLSQAVKKRADLRLSMSPMTFPHQLARVLLLEQIYRAFSINAGTKYHK